MNTKFEHLPFIFLTDNQVENISKIENKFNRKTNKKKILALLKILK